jgi:3'-phosphoadenosine 5'-phosphosulfate sulfotransferase (PAPS reductase)/FAD synthetase
MDALHFSGGMDSIACLWKLRDQWDDLTVMWCNTGAAYDDTLGLIRRVERLVPHFREVSSDQPENVRRCGFPADVVPVRITPFGRILHDTRGVQFRPYYECCSNNIWTPLLRATQELGAKTVYRGQRKSDTRKAPISSGFVDEAGVRYVFPLEDWTREEVREYVRDNCPHLLPEYYEHGEDSSHDCWDCTAYLDDNALRISNLPSERRSVVLHRLTQLQMAIEFETQALNDMIGG